MRIWWSGILHYGWSAAKTFFLAPKLSPHLRLLLAWPPALWKSNTPVMLSKVIGAFALSICLVNAFKDTSPFFLFSTSEYVQIFGRSRAPLIYNFQTPRILPRPYFRNLSQQHHRSRTRSMYIRYVHRRLAARRQCSRLPGPSGALSTDENARR